MERRCPVIVSGEVVFPNLISGVNPSQRRYSSAGARRGFPEQWCRHTCLLVIGKHGTLWH